MLLDISLQLMSERRDWCETRNTAGALFTRVACLPPNLPDFLVLGIGGSPYQFVG